MKRNKLEKNIDKLLKEVQLNFSMIRVIDHNSYKHLMKLSGEYYKYKCGQQPMSIGTLIFIKKFLVAIDNISQTVKKNQNVFEAANRLKPPSKEDLERILQYGSIPQIPQASTNQALVDVLKKETSGEFSEDYRQILSTNPTKLNEFLTLIQNLAPDESTKQECNRLAKEDHRLSTIEHHNYQDEGSFDHKDSEPRTQWKQDAKTFALGESVKFVNVYYKLNDFKNSSK